MGRPTVDKHSTGGVGDKISLPLAPLVAACGAAVPQLSGRGLGHTGGTLDKMESIAGWRAMLSPAEMIAQLTSVGAVICAASADLAPADRKLYALRDVTGTVESIPMIAASIMSKKIAEGTDALVLDVKVGSGAFMKRADHAAELARTMVELGAREGVRTTALLTDMSTPLGVAVGNAVEVAESVEVLAGGGPADVVELTIALAREMVALAGLDGDPAEVLRVRPGDGQLAGRWSPRRAAIRMPRCPTPKDTGGGRAEASGVVVGLMRWPSGSPPGGSAPAGRAGSMPCSRRPESCAWPSRGIRQAGAPLFELHTDTPERFFAALADLADAVTIDPDAAPGHRGRSCWTRSVLSGLIDLPSSGGSAGAFHRFSLRSLHSTGGSSHGRCPRWPGQIYEVISRS